MTLSLLFADEMDGEMPAQAIQSESSILSGKFQAARFALLKVTLDRSINKAADWHVARQH